MKPATILIIGFKKRVLLLNRLVSNKSKIYKFSKKIDELENKCRQEHLSIIFLINVSGSELKVDS